LCGPQTDLQSLLINERKHPQLGILHHGQFVYQLLTALLLSNDFKIMLFSSGSSINQSMSNKSS